MEVGKRFRSPLKMIRPTAPLKGVAGHLWEQCVLPSRFKNQMLWSPCNTGPLAVARQILTIHDLSALDHPEWFSTRFGALYAWLLPRLTKRVSHIVAVSTYTKKRLMERLKVPDEKITVIPNGVGPEFFPRDPEEVKELRRKLHIPHGPYVLSVCSLEPRKNLARLLSAWTEVEKSHPGISLVIAGAKGSSAIFRQSQARISVPGVFFTGYVADADLPVLYSGASCFVYPSLYEGFGLPVLEGLACGIPVITSNCTSIPEIAASSTVLVDPLSAGEIASAMIKAIRASNSSERESALGQAHARNYSWERCANATEKLLLSLC